MPQLMLCFVLTTPLLADEARWPQFRGPNGSGVADEAKPPVVFGAETNLTWRVPVPPGPSSPCIWADRIFLTAFDQGKLQTICLRRDDGQVQWRQAAPAEKLEVFHEKEGSPAASTPVSDGERVYVYFGSCGMIAYDMKGVEQWRHPMPTIETFGGFGTGASPLLVDGLVIMPRDGLGKSELLALDAASGNLRWRTDRGQSYSWCSPVLWKHDAVQEIVMPASAVLKGYSLQTGAERWALPGLAAATCSTPVTGDGWLFVSSWSPTEAATAPEPFAAVLGKLDKNKDGLLSREEAAEWPLQPMFQSFDLNQNGQVSADEYDRVRSLALRSKNGLLGIRAAGVAPITEAQVVWRQQKGLPYVPSPLLYRGRLYVVKDGGLVSCFEPETGKPIYLQERLGALGSYYASPVAADGRIYAASVTGTVTVFKAADELQVLARNELGERLSASPAIVGDYLYIRTATHLYAFGAKNKLKPWTFGPYDRL